MMTSFLTILYEDLLIGEQVDVYSHRSSMSCCLTNFLNVPALQQLPACSSDVFDTSIRRGSNFSRKRKATRSTKKEGKVAVARRRTKEK